MGITISDESKRKSRNTVEATKRRSWNDDGLEKINLFDVFEQNL